MRSHDSDPGLAEPTACAPTLPHPGNPALVSTSGYASLRQACGVLKTWSRGKHLTLCSPSCFPRRFLGLGSARAPREPDRDEHVVPQDGLRDPPFLPSFPTRTLLYPPGSLRGHRASTCSGGTEGEWAHPGPADPGLRPARLCPLLLGVLRQCPSPMALDPPRSLY